MRLNEKVLVFTDPHDEPVAIRNRITPQIGDTVVVHELEDGTFITHGKDRFKLGDSVLVFDDPEDSLMVRIGAEQPLPNSWDWLDETLDPWIETAYGYHSGVYVGSEGFGHNTMYAQGSPIQIPPEAECEADDVYGRWTMRYKFTTPYTVSHLARWIFIDDGTDNYNIYINSDDATIGLYKNNTLLNSAFFSLSVDARILEITRDWNGLFTVSVDGVEYFTAIDNTITSSIKERIWFFSSYGTREWYIDYIQFDELV